MAALHGRRPRPARAASTAAGGGSREVSEGGRDLAVVREELQRASELCLRLCHRQARAVAYRRRLATIPPLLAGWHRVAAGQGPVVGGAAAAAAAAAASADRAQ